VSLQIKVHKTNDKGDADQVSSTFFQRSGEIYVSKGDQTRNAST